MLTRAVRWHAVLAAITCAILIPRVPALAQSQATSGVIRGTVTNAAGELVPSATVTLLNLQTNILRTTTTNSDGVFVAPLLAVGIYDVRARLVGATEARRDSVVLRLGETVDLALQLGAIQLEAIQVTGQALPLVDPARVEEVTRMTPEVVQGLPNNGRNFLNLTLLTPGVAIVQGPDGDELTVSGQRGIYNNVSVDGADFNNPFFGEQRGGQRPAFTFNQDAVQEMTVVNDGANAEFGRSGGGFVTVLTKSGTNEFKGSLHYFGQSDAFSASQFRNQGNPSFAQNQFGFTVGGPIVRNKAFFFIAYDQQLYHQTKQTVPLAQRLVLRSDTASARLLQAWTDTAFGGVLRGDFGSIRRTNDAQALMVKLDWHISAEHSASLKYNYTNSRQDNGTFDVDTWARSSNAVEKDYSHAVNGSLVSLLSGSVTNELRAEFAREYRPRPYEGPTFPGTDGSLWHTNGRPIPDIGIDYNEGFRMGMPFFIPVDAYDQRIQILDNVSIARGRHLFKVGAEFNRTNENQTFIGFSDGRYIFTDVPGFLQYLANPRFVECSDGTTSPTGTCAGTATITGPLNTYLQFAPVGSGTVRDAGTQNLVQYEYAAFIQDSWKPNPRLTVNYGLRWEAQVEPPPITPPDQVFFRPFIGATSNGQAFPSDGKIPSDYGMWQPRLGMAWDIKGDASQVIRANAGMYSARSPGLIFASTRTSNGSVGQTLFCSSSFYLNCGATPPPLGPTLLSPGTGTPDHPTVYVTDKNFTNPRTLALGASYERRLGERMSASLTLSYAHTTHLNRFVNRNDPVFGTGGSGPWNTFPGGTNGIGQLWTLESTAKSTYYGFTLALAGSLGRWMQFQGNYTLSFDKSDDDNERDPFKLYYAVANRLDREYNWSDRDQRHRVNLWMLQHLPYGIELNHRFSAYSAQPTSASCGPWTGNPNAPPAGQPAVTPQDRICSNGTILLRNSIRKDNAFFQWDLRISRPFPVAHGSLEAMIEVFNLTNTFNLRKPGSPALLFNFDGTIRSGLGDPRRAQAGLRYTF